MAGSMYAVPSTAPSLAPSTPPHARDVYSNVRRKDQKEANIQVVVRCRGRSGRDIRENSPIVVSTSGARGKEVYVKTTALDTFNRKTFTFDSVFGPDGDQAMIYEDVVAPILEEVLMGYNCTIFAYGQTGTGKTYTMEGDLIPRGGSYSDDAGIIPRTLFRLFYTLENSGTEFSVRISFIELYNEELRDLLSPPESQRQIKIYEDSSKKGVRIQGLDEHLVNSATDAIKLLQAGSNRRSIASTKCNEQSSRSHSVFSITLHIKETNSQGEDLLKVGKLNLVDLAGSENILRSGAQDKRVREAGMINQSLLTLGRVINALVEKSSHVPYRESKLTRMLQDSLGGKTKTCIIATISATSSNIEETMSTLDYASRAKNIRNKPEVNQRMTKKALIKEYQAEIERLRADLLASREKNGIYLSTETYKQLTEDNDGRQKQVDELRKQIEIAEIGMRSTKEQFEHNLKLLNTTECKVESLAKDLKETADNLEQSELMLNNMKQTIEDERQLRMAHESTEDQLHSIATTLVNTLDQSTADVEILQDKFNIVKDLDKENKMTLGEFEHCLRSRTESMQGGLEDFKSVTDDLMTSLQKSMMDFEQRQVLELTMNQQYIVEQLEHIQNRSFEVSRLVGESSDATAQISKDLGQLKTEMNEAISNSLRKMRGSTCILIDDLGKQMETFESKIRRTLKGLAAASRNMFDGYKEFSESHTVKINGLRHLSCRAADEYIQRLRRRNVELERLVLEENERIARERDDAMDKIGEIISQLAKGRQDRLKEVSSVVTSMTNDDEAEMTKFSKDIHSSTRHVVQEYAKFGEQLSMTEKGYSEKIEKDIKQVQQDYLPLLTSIKNSKSNLDGQFYDLVIEVNAHVNPLDDVKSRLQRESELVRSRLCSHTEEHDRHTIQTLNSVTKDLETHKGDISDLAQEIIHAAASHSTLTSAYYSRSSSDLKRMRKETEEVINMKLKRYQSTGKTPLRTRYEYPRTWDRTLPHSEIIQRLRDRAR